MNVIIENYRGFEIYFNTQKEEFYTSSNQYDTEKYKKTYSATKKFIDDFIKENTDFKPIKVMKQRSMYGNCHIITLIGIRKDGRFTYEDEQGIKKQLSEYDEKDYFIVNNENEKYFKELDKLYLESKNISDKIKEVDAKIIKFNVKQFKESIK